MRETTETDQLMLTDTLAGETTPQERARFDRWVAAFPEQKRRLLDWRRMWCSIRNRERETVDVEAINRNVLAYVMVNREVGSALRGDLVTPIRGANIPDISVGNGGIEDSGRVVSSLNRTINRSFMAASALVIGLGVLYTTNSFNLAPSFFNTNVEHVFTYATARGRQQAVVLTDGTHVALAPDSKMVVRMPRTGTRTVDLDGEAIFTVAHTEQRPFVVRTRGATVRVLGTTFGVRWYAGDPVTRVAVQDGKVAMNAIALVAGDLGESFNDGTTRVSRSQNLNSVFGWVDGTLVFQDTPLSEITAQLSRWYDIDVVLADPALSDVPFTLTTHRETLDAVMSSIARAANVQVTRQGRVITISSVHQ